MKQPSRIQLPTPQGWTRSDRQRFLALAEALEGSGLGQRGEIDSARSRCVRADRPSLEAAAAVLADLFNQGWSVGVSGGHVSVGVPDMAVDVTIEKERVRQQELIKRNEQISIPSVNRFIAEMERPREYHGRFVSIFNLMRDGAGLESALRSVADQPAPEALHAVIDPYVQVVNYADRCPFTGLRLGDVWRYFRHTWSNQYTSTPGRTMLLLIRDRAADDHPVIGIAALGSPIVQIRERDDWIGWQAAPFLRELDIRPNARVARWALERLEAGRSEIYVDDLIEDGLFWPSLWDEPSTDAIERLKKESEARRNDHRRFARAADLKRTPDADDPDEWIARAESDLFRSKRCLALANLLRSRAALAPHLIPRPTREGLVQAMSDPAARRAIGDLLRHAKAESVGTEMADLTVCGAIAPYNALLGGKLVSMLAVSPTVIREYRDRYSSYASVIASSIAGRPIRRRSNLVFIGTTSLYGSGSSQYNRIRIPAEYLDGTKPLEFRQLGRSRSFGTSHFSAETVSALVRLSETSRTGIRVNSIFGEGVNPKLRKVRDGIDLLGWPSEELMRHGRNRIVYGVSLVSNLLPYLVGLDKRPNYVFSQRIQDDVDRIAAWWADRWLAPRIRSEDVLNSVASHVLDRPVRHGARVQRPDADSPDQR